MSSSELRDYRLVGLSMNRGPDAPGEDHPPKPAASGPGGLPRGPRSITIRMVPLCVKGRVVSTAPKRWSLLPKQA
jgi:hypothetical protein